MFSPKERLILQVLSEKNNFLTSYEIAESTGLTQRSIRDIIKRIKPKIIQIENITLITKPYSGYRLVFTNPYAKHNFKNEIEISSYNINHSAIVQRQLVIFSCLTTQKEAIKIDDFEEILYISRTHISNIIKEIRDFLEPFYVYIETVSNKGIKIVGSENDIRCAMGKFYLIYLHEFLINEYDDKGIEKFNTLYASIKVSLEKDNRKNTNLNHNLINNIAVNSATHILRIKNKRYLEDFTLTKNNNLRFTNQNKLLTYWSVIKKEIPTYLKIEYLSLNAYIEMHLFESNKFTFHPLNSVTNEIVNLSLGNISKKLGGYFSSNLIRNDLISLINNYLNDLITGNYYLLSEQSDLTSINLSSQITCYFFQYMLEIANIEFDKYLINYSSIIFNNYLESIELPKINIAFSQDVNGSLKQSTSIHLKHIGYNFLTIYNHRSPSTDCILSNETLGYCNIPVIQIPLDYSNDNLQKLYYKLHEIWKINLYDLFKIRINEIEETKLSSQQLQSKLNSLSKRKDNEIIFHYHDKQYYVVWMIQPETESNFISAYKLTKPIKMYSNKINYILYIYHRLLTSNKYMQIICF